MRQMRNPGSHPGVDAKRRPRPWAIRSFNPVGSGVLRKRKRGKNEFEPGQCPRMNARDSRRDSRRHRFVIGPAISSDSNESGEFAEINRWGAGLPGLRFQSLELISGDFKRFKGISLDSTSKIFEQARVNHLSARLAIISETKRGKRVTHFLNSPERCSKPD